MDSLLWWLAAAGLVVQGLLLPGRGSASLRGRAAGVACAAAVAAFALVRRDAVLLAGQGVVLMIFLRTRSGPAGPEGHK